MVVSFFMSMVLQSPCTREATLADTTPAVPAVFVAKCLAAARVAGNQEAGTQADAASAASAVPSTAVESVNPWRASRAASTDRALASRLATVPSGQRSRLATSLLL